MVSPSVVLTWLAAPASGAHRCHLRSRWITTVMRLLSAEAEVPAVALRSGIDVRVRPRSWPCRYRLADVPMFITSTCPTLSG